MRILFLCGALMVVAPLTCIAGDGPSTLHLTLPPAFTQALRDGDLHSLQQLVEHGKVGPVSAAYAYAHIRYQLPELLQDLQRCQRVALQKKSPVTAAICNGMGRTTALRLGEAHLYLEEGKFLKDHILTVFARKYHRTYKIGNGLDKIDIAKVAAATPPLRVSWLAQKASLPMRNPEKVAELAGPPKVQITIDGVSVNAKIRPSSGFTATLTIIVAPNRVQETYAKLGLTELVDPLHPQKVNGQVKPAVDDPKLALANSVRFGPLQLHHLGVAVWPSNRIPHGIYVGMSLLSRFGGVAISDRKVVLSMKPLAACKGLVPMTHAGVKGGGRLRFSALLNTTPVNTTWNPSYRTSIMVDPTTFSKATAHPASGFIASGSAAPVSVTVRVGGTTLHPKSISASHHLSAEPQQMIIGEGALRHYVVHLRFGGEQPMIGFCKHAGTSASLHGTASSTGQQ